MNRFFHEMVAFNRIKDITKTQIQYDYVWIIVKSF